jgi:hypothetical protein
MNLVTPKAGAEHELLFNKPAYEYFKINFCFNQNKEKGKYSQNFLTSFQMGAP